MAKDRTFFRSLAYIDRRTKVPQNSLWLQCLWICILIMWGNYAQLLDYVIYSSIIFYAITIWGIYKMRKICPKKEDTYQVPNWIPITFTILSGIIILALTIFKPLYTVPGLFISLIGLPVYNHWNKKQYK